jgi:hypothetical protein
MHGSVPAPRRQKAARKALASTPRHTGGTLSPQPPPLGGGSSRSQARQARAQAAFNRKIGRQIDRAQPLVRHQLLLAREQARLSGVQVLPASKAQVRYGQEHNLAKPDGTYFSPQQEAAAHAMRAANESAGGRVLGGASHLLGVPLLKIGASELIHGRISDQNKSDYQRQAKISEQADKAALEAMAPQSAVDIAHGHAPSAQHLGTDALFFTPWSRGLRAVGEGIKAAAAVEDAGRVGEAASRAAESYKSGQGLGHAALSGAKKLLPSERALNASVARQKLFEHIDSHLPRAHAAAVKRTVDQSVKAMVKNGQARSVEEAIGKIADTHVGEIPNEIKGLYQTVPPQAPPEMPARLRVKGLPPRVYRLIQKGAAYRDWYTRGARVLADAADRLGVSHSQMAAVTAVMSQGANPTFNLRRAVEAIQEFKQTGQIDPSTFLPGQAEKAAHILSSPDTFDWSGLKTNSYFGNFLQELDPAMYRQLFGDAQKVTVDRHMAAMFLGKKSVTEKQYLQVEQILTKTAAHLGWTPKEVQAAAWVPFKAGNIQESSTLRALSKEMAARNEIPAELLGPGKAMSQKRAAFLHEQLAAGRMPEGYTPSPLETYMPTAADAYERGQAKYRGTLYQILRKGLENRPLNQRLIDTHDSGVQWNVIAPDWVVHDGAGDMLLQRGDFKEPPRSAGDVFLRKAEASGVPIQGAFEVTDAGRRAIFHLTHRMDVTTVPHELAHFLEHFGLSPEDKAVIEKWTGPLDNENAHEQFARGLEALVRSGDAPNNLVKEFNAIRPAFLEKYPAGADLPRVPDAVAAVYKKLLGHRDGVPASLYFALRNVAVGASKAGKKGDPRSPEEAAQHVAEVSARMRQRGFGALEPDVAKLKAGEESAATGGEAGAAVRRALAGKVDTEGMGSYEALGAKMDTLPAHQARDLQEEARHVERTQRVAKIVRAAESKSGLDRHIAAKSQMGGEYTSAYWTGFKGPVEENLNFLVDHVYEHPGLQPWEKSNAVDALLNGIRRGKVPTKSEQKLLERAFGREIQGGVKAALLGGTLEQRLANVANIPRSLMASGDLSAPFRQGLVVMASHPAIFWEGFGPMLKAAKSERFFQAEVAAIHGMDTFPLMHRAHLSLTDIGATTKGVRDLSAREEGFQSNLAEQIPGVGHMVRGSDRAYVLFLNRTRMHALQRARAAGSRVRLGSRQREAARGHREVREQRDGQRRHRQARRPHGLPERPLLLAAADGVPLQLPQPAYYMRMEPFARKQALRAATRLAGTLSTVLLFAHLAGATVVADPRNADFGKIRIGDTRLDIAGGFTQPIRLVSQLTSGTDRQLHHRKGRALSGGFGRQVALRRRPRSSSRTSSPPCPEHDRGSR